MLPRNDTIYLASSFGGSVGNADYRGLYVILSASEISHHQSEENMPVSYSVGFFTPVIRRIMLTHFKTIVLHFCKMLAPYEYLRSQTLASKFAHLTLTE